MRLRSDRKKALRPLAKREAAQLLAAKADHEKVPSRADARMNTESRAGLG